MFSMQMEHGSGCVGRTSWGKRTHTDNMYSDALCKLCTHVPNIACEIV